MIEWLYLNSKPLSPRPQAIRSVGRRHSPKSQVEGLPPQLQLSNGPRSPPLSHPCRLIPDANVNIWVGDSKTSKTIEPRRCWWIWICWCKNMWELSSQGTVGMGSLPHKELRRLLAALCLACRCRSLSRVSTFVTHMLVKKSFNAASWVSMHHYSPRWTSVAPVHCHTPRPIPPGLGNRQRIVISLYHEGWRVQHEWQLNIMMLNWQSPWNRGKTPPSHPGLTKGFFQSPKAAKCSCASSCQKMAT